MTVGVGTAENAITLRPATAPAPTACSLLVPAYQYPTVGGFWAALEAAAPTVAGLVANPASGPGSSANSDYTTAIAAAQGKGIRVYGYVTTIAATVPLATVQTNVGLWSSLYGISDIFFDQCDPSAASIAYYTTATGYPAGKKALNFGAIPNSGYGPLADILVVFENAWDFWPPAWPSWFTTYALSKFAVLVHNVPSWSAAAAVMATARANVGSMYLTNEGEPNAYDTLPPWWLNEVAQAAV